MWRVLRGTAGAPNYATTPRAGRVDGEGGQALTGSRTPGRRVTGREAGAAQAGAVDRGAEGQRPPFPVGGLRKGEKDSGRNGSDTAMPQRGGVAEGGGGWVGGGGGAAGAGQHWAEWRHPPRTPRRGTNAVEALALGGGTLAT